MALFDNKHFNGEVFRRYTETIPNPRLNVLLNSGAIVERNDLIQSMADQVGGNYISTPIRGNIFGEDPVNYDGETDITASSTASYLHSRIVVGRAKAWKEKDFTYDITGGEDPMQTVVAPQVTEYWNEVKEDILATILKGVFSMTGGANGAFVQEHTYDIRGIINADNELGKVDATTLNKAMQKACGDNKGVFALFLCHSVVSTNLENKKLIEYYKYNDAEGIERDLTIYSWNGRVVLVSDRLPAEPIDAVYTKTADESIDTDKTYYTRSGSAGNYTYTAVASPVVGSIGSYYEKTAEAYTAYHSYVLGRGAIEYTDCGAKVPYEVSRNPATNGGEDLLYSRTRVCYAPYGISFTKASMAKASPTDAELANGANWELVHTSSDVAKTIPGKTIAIACLISRG